MIVEDVVVLKEAAEDFFTNEFGRKLKKMSSENQEKLGKTHTR